MVSKMVNKLVKEQEQVVEAYRNGATLRDIGDVYNCSPGTVRNVLIEAGEPLRPRGRRKLGETHDPRILRVSPDPAASDAPEGETPGAVHPLDHLQSDYEGGTF